MPRRRISTRETKQLSLLGGSNRRFNEADTNWNFSNLITPSTNEHRITEALDDSSATSSSSADSQSTYSNDDYAEEDFTNDVVSTHRELKGGNRLINLQDLLQFLPHIIHQNRCIYDCGPGTFLKNKTREKNNQRELQKKVRSKGCTFKKTEETIA
jgi:hypothetical protein